MTLKDILRTLFGIRVERKPLPLDHRPLVGSNIVRDNVRIRLKHLISDEQWEWFAGHGWRVTDMRTDRRKYVCVPEKALVKLLKADQQNRDSMHVLLLQWAARQGTKNKRRRTVSRNRKSATRVENASASTISYR